LLVFFDDVTITKLNSFQATQLTITNAFCRLREYFSNLVLQSTDHFCAFNDQVFTSFQLETVTQHFSKLMDLVFWSMEEH